MSILKSLGEMASLESILLVMLGSITLLLTVWTVVRYPRTYLKILCYAVGVLALVLRILITTVWLSIISITWILSVISRVLLVITKSNCPAIIAISYLLTLKGIKFATNFLNGILSREYALVIGKDVGSVDVESSPL